MTGTVLIPSFKRPAALRRCLDSLASQATKPDQVLVAWQADDIETRDLVEEVARLAPFPMRAVHSERIGVVPAENAALDQANGEVILLIDDDATAPPEWFARHMKHYEDSSVGAVGGPADNVYPDGTPFPRRSDEPVGALSWWGRTTGNMHDQPIEWRTRPPIPVDHLVGYNMSLRRAAFDRFEEGLKPYWQMFETDACLQVRRRGFSVLFDFANVVEHRPTNTAYTSGRQGDLQVKIFNAAFNQALVLAKHSSKLQWPARLAQMLLIGSVNAPGLAGWAVAWRRYGHLGREMKILRETWKSRLAGARVGRAARKQMAKS
jgi:GT2 family glycosyltransferase